MENIKPTDYDITIAVREYRKIARPTLVGSLVDGPSIAVFSFGYGEVWSDGEVIAFGRVVFTVDSAGVVS